MSDTLSFTIQFPLADGRTLVQGPLSYNADGLATRHSADFMRDPLFAEAYRLAMSTGHVFGPNLHVEWRIYVGCWIASNAIRLDGDFVECGVASGMLSRAILHYVSWNPQSERLFWLLDTFEGYPVEQLSEAERAAGLTSLTQVYDNSYERVQQTFAAYKSVQIVKGVIPSTLADITSERIAYLHLDCNAAAPERAAIELLWDRLVPGAFILMDDYGWAECINQKMALDAFAASKGLRILSMPTGQGLLIKPNVI